MRNPNGELLVGCRTNQVGQVGSKMRQVAGSTLVGVAHEHLPLTYMIVDIVLGKGGRVTRLSRTSSSVVSHSAPHSSWHGH